ncbi:MAG: hypothetical protein OIF34_01885 [Porticoccaceae bacterium]|nr:hypothetical protein [Porticoccaceae bacterium]
MATPTLKLIIAGFVAASCSLTSPLSIGTEDAIGQYLACINAQTKGEDGKNSDDIADVNQVLDACSSERQAVIDSMPEEQALKHLPQIEYHLMGRERQSKAK